MWPFLPKPCTDHDFVAAFEWFVETTRGIFDEPCDGYEPIVVTQRGQRVCFHVLTPDEDPGEPVYLKDVLRDFGEVLRRRWFKPQIVLAAILGETLDDQFEVQLSGCTPDLRECVAALHLEKDEQGNYRVTDTEKYLFNREDPVHHAGRRSAREIVVKMLGHDEDPPPITTPGG